MFLDVANDFELFSVTFRYDLSRSAISFLFPSKSNFKLSFATLSSNSFSHIFTLENDY